MRTRTAEQIAEMKRIEDSLRAGQIEGVWVIELTTGSPGISEVTSHWWIIPADKADSEKSAIEYCCGSEPPDNYEGHPVTSIFALRQVSLLGCAEEGDETNTIPAAFTIEELKALFEVE